MTLRTVEMDFEYQNVIEGPPKSPKELFTQASSSDAITIETWRKTWIANIAANHNVYGPFADKSIGKLFGKYARQPVICAGSGPSLKDNGHLLKDTKGIPVVSCLHNFHFMVDNQVPVEAFVSLDAGEITIEEISEGGKHDHQYYVDATKDHTLCAFIGSHPKLLAMWKGKILFFNCPVPDEVYMQETSKIEEFSTWMTSGGNVLGACTYLAKAILGANPIAWVGANYAFDYKKKFHGWDSKYDKDIGRCLRAQDIFGHKVLTWSSYFNFKNHTEWLACTVPGIYFNCTEGGILGAYPEGNIRQITNMDLSAFIRMFSVYEEMQAQCLDPKLGEKKILF